MTTLKKGDTVVLVDQLNTPDQRRVVVVVLPHAAPHRAEILIDAPYDGHIRWYAEDWRKVD